jgi:sodium/bile acid cotransporter 7
MAADPPLHCPPCTFRFLSDNFTLALLATVALATVWPASGALTPWFERLTVAAVGLLFFLRAVKP